MVSFDEVPEHIAPEHEEELMQTLTQAKVAIVVSWALLGQAGHGHVNEHSQSYLETRSLPGVYLIMSVSGCPFVSEFCGVSLKVIDKIILVSILSV